MEGNRDVQTSVECFPPFLLKKKKKSNLRKPFLILSTTNKSETERPSEHLKCARCGKPPTESFFFIDKNPGRDCRAAFTLPILYEKHLASPFFVSIPKTHAVTRQEDVTVQRLGVAEQQTTTLL